MRYRWITALAVIAMIVGISSAYAMGSRKGAVVPEEKVEELVGEAITQTECEGSLSAQMGPYSFTIPRKVGVTLKVATENSSTKINNLHKKSPIPCEEKIVKDVRKISMEEYVLSLPFEASELSFFHSSKPVPSYYKNTKSALKYMGEVKEEKIEHDITRYETEGGNLYYILPLDKAPTINNEPVTFNCSGSRTRYPCFTRYGLPNGIYVEYKLRRYRQGEADILAKDKQVRDYVMSLISKQTP